MKTAMIFAAGRGERLRPITDLCPKAMCRVHHIPLIEYHVTNLAAAGFTRLIINHAYLGGQIRQHLGTGKRWNVKIIYSPEPPGALETGGGIVHALPLLGSEPFVTVNADIFTDYPFASLSLPSKSLAHLVLVPHPPYTKQGDFGLSKNRALENDPKEYTFAGVACYHPILFEHRTLGRYSVTPILRQLASEKRATGEVYQGKWFDIGSPERLALANELML